MARRNNARQLPSWFNLENYRGFRTLSLVDWGINLCVRDEIWASAEKDGEANLPPDIHALLTKIRERPVLTRADATHIYDVQASLALFRARIDDGAGTGVVYSLPLDTAFDIYKTIHGDTKLRTYVAAMDYHRVFRDESEEPLDQDEERLKYWHAQVFEGTPFRLRYPPSESTDVPCICVELDAPDDLIVESFRSWLAAKRSRDAALDPIGLRHMRDSRTRRWADAGVMPYTDLRQNCEFQGTELPWHVIGGAILPEDSNVDVAEAARKTTSKLADEAFSDPWGFLRWAIRMEARQNAGKKT